MNLLEKTPNVKKDNFRPQSTLNNANLLENLRLNESSESSSDEGSAKLQTLFLKQNKTENNNNNMFKF